MNYCFITRIKKSIFIVLSVLFIKIELFLKNALVYIVCVGVCVLLLHLEYPLTK